MFGNISIVIWIQNVILILKSRNDIIFIALFNKTIKLVLHILKPNRFSRLWTFVCFYYKIWWVTVLLASKKAFPGYLYEYVTILNSRLYKDDIARKNNTARLS